MEKPPIIDGEISEEKWKEAAELTGFSMPQGFINVLPESFQPRVWIGYDKTKLYLAIRAPRIPETKYGWGASVKDKAKGNAILGGNHWWLKFHTPKKGYEFIFNTLGTLRDRSDANSYTPDEGLDWKSGAEFKTKLSDKWWDAELAIPFASMGCPDGLADNERWMVHLIYGGNYGDYYAEWNGAQNWNNQRCGLLIFSGKIPAFQFHRIAGLEDGKMELEAFAGNFTGKAQEVRVKASLCCADKELWGKEEVLKLADGERKPVAFEKSGIELPKDFTGRLELEAETPTDILQRIVMQFSPITPPDYRIISKALYPYKSPLSDVWDLNCANYPYYCKLEAWADVTFPLLPEEIRHAVSCDVELKSVNGGGPIKSGSIELKDGKGRILWTNVDLPDGEYAICGRLKGSGGNVGEVVEHRFERRKFAWEHNDVGKSDTPYPPFTPIRKTESPRGKPGFSVWGRIYEVGDNALPGEIVATKETGVPGQVISKPPRLEITRAGKTELLKGATKVGKEKDGVVDFSSEVEATPGLSLKTSSTLQYDGWYHVKMRLEPLGGGQDVDRLELVVPLGEYPDTYYGYRNSWFYGDLSKKEGGFWDNERNERGNQNYFTPALALGNGDTSIWWYANSDQDWQLDYRQPSQFITRDADGESMRFLFVNHHATIAKPLEFEFALLANPVKPFDADRRAIVWGLKPRKLFHDTGGYGYWGTGVDSITCGDDAGYKRFSDFLDRWTKRKEPGNEGLMVVEYNSCLAIGRCQPEFDTFSGEWCGQTPLPVTAEFKDSDFSSRIGLFHPTANYYQDWRGRPKKLTPGWGALTKSMVDCRLWHYKANMEKLGLNGYWFDNSPITAGEVVATGYAYLAADGKTRPNYNVFERHELFRRLFALYKEAGKEPLNLNSYGPDFSFAQWFWMIEMDAYVYTPKGTLYDTLSRWNHYDIISRITGVDSATRDPVAAHRAITRMKSLPGATCSNVNQDNIQGSRSVVGLALLHDFGVLTGVSYAEQAKNMKALRRFDFGNPEVKYLPYWRNQSHVKYSDAAIPVSLYQHPSKAIIGVAVNPTDRDAPGTLSLDLKAIGIKNPVLLDPETLDKLAAETKDGKLVADFPIPQRNHRLFLLKEKGEEDILRKTTGTLDREYWLGIPGANLKDLTGYAGFKDDKPSGRDMLSSFEFVAWDDPSKTTSKVEKFGERIRGYITPPETGDYIFWIAGADECQLALSTGEKPENARMIACVPVSTGFRQWPWQADAPNKSKPVELKAGRVYYVEVLHKKNVGGGYLTVAWTKPFDNESKPTEIVPSVALSAFAAGVPKILSK